AGRRACQAECIRSEPREALRTARVLIFQRSVLFESRDSSSAIPASTGFPFSKSFSGSHLVFLVMFITLVPALVAVIPTGRRPSFRICLDNLRVVNRRSVMEIHPH